MAFTRISRDESTKTEVYSDGDLEITIVHPANHTSGFPLEVSVQAADKPLDAPQDNAKVEGEDVQPPATHEEFEKL